MNRPRLTTTAAWSAALTVTLTLGGCASSGAPVVADDEIERTLAQVTVAPPPPLPQDVADALLPADVPVAVEPAGERFDVNVTDTPAKAFFAGLVDGTSTNLVVHPKVSGKISLHMKRVTIEEVLAMVREVYGYDVRPQGGGFVVMPATLQSRIFQVDYLDMQRSGMSRMRVSSGQVSERRSGGAQGNRGVDSQGGGDGGEGGQSVTGSRIDTTYAVDFWGDLEATLHMIVGTAADRRVVINPQTGVIMVRAMPEELRAVEEYLATVQATAQRQVLLEAKVVEVELSEGFQAGVNWVAIAQNASGNTFGFGQNAPASPGGFRVDSDSIGGGPISVAPGVQYGGFDSGSLGGAFTLAFDVGDFNTFIELLEVQGRTRVLSSPRVATLNNQKAVIKAGTDEFFVTDVSSNTVTGTSATTSRDVELTPFFSGIALDVTPQISAGGVVTLHIHPTVSTVTDQEKDLTISGETDRLPLAFSEVRESDTVVRARSGQIIVIGGLMRESSREQDFRTPVLSKVPGLGALFRSKREVARKSELVILLKPIVVEDDRAWSDAARRSLERIQGMSRR